MTPEVPGIEAYAPAAGDIAPAWVFGGPTWLREGERCLATAVHEAAQATLRTETCATPTEACHLVLHLDGGLEVGGEICLTADGAARKNDWGAGPPEARVWPITDASGTVVRWGRPSRLVVTVANRSEELRTCSERSLRALTRAAAREGGAETVEDRLLARGVVDGHRRCDTSTGLALHEVPLGSGLGLGFGTATTIVDGVFDCREPCPANPTLAALAAAEQALEGVWTRRGAPVAALYRTEGDCRAAPPIEPWISSGAGACAR